MNETGDIKFEIPLIPISSEWSAELVPGYIYRPYKGNEPNWFHRFMQRLCFGIVWSKK